MVCRQRGHARAAVWLHPEMDTASSATADMSAAAFLIMALVSGFLLFSSMALSSFLLLVI